MKIVIAGGILNVVIKIHPVHPPAGHVSWQVRVIVESEGLKIRPLVVLIVIKTGVEIPVESANSMHIPKVRYVDIRAIGSVINYF